MNSLGQIRSVAYPSGSHKVAHHAAETLCSATGAIATSATAPLPEAFNIALAEGAWNLKPAEASPSTDHWIWLLVNPDGSGCAIASKPHLLLQGITLLRDGLLTEVQEHSLQNGILIEPAFTVNRPHFDFVLTQTYRHIRNMDAEQHIRMMAENGFTHVEVNALSTFIPFEPGVPNEYYNQFYSYCAALSQFVDSKITKGFYPYEYQSANLNLLKKLSKLGREYGLKPGILTFEPRTMPGLFFDKYPTLRGARVDHPLRSHLPRYTMAQDHPLTRDHYRQMMDKLMHAVPDLDYMSVWTNDSGSGFEYTSSLYVGRNGGPYMIREWRSHEKIAEAAAASAVRWLKLLQETAATVNPDFNVILRVEPFKVEHEYILNGIGGNVTIEAPSLLVKGYHLPYTHPKYPEQASAAGTIMHTRMDAEETEKLAWFRSKGCEPYLNYASGSGYNIEPLMGIPFPFMLAEKLKSLKDIDIKRISAFGGLMNTAATPYWPHPEVIRHAVLNPEVDLNTWLTKVAERWIGTAKASKLVELWRAVDEAIAWLPVVPLYSTLGFVWYRLWIRPMVPNLEAIPFADREYCERLIVTVPNNPQNVDLGRDVLFELVTEESGGKMTEQFDQYVVPRIDAIINDLRNELKDADDQASDVLTDLLDRMRAFRSWCLTQRHVCAWVHGVHGYLNTTDAAKKKQRRAFLAEAMEMEIANAKDLLELWNTSETEFMAISDISETAYIHGENLGEQIERKIQLMEAYKDVEPYIDPEVLWRTAYKA